MNIANENKFFGMILAELKKSEIKHPEFCKVMSSDGLVYWQWAEKQSKKGNEKQEEAARIFLEKFAEAFLAYEQENKNDCIEKLAQCGAIIVRTMEFANANKEKPNERTNRMLGKAYCQAHETGKKNSRNSSKRNCQRKKP